VDGELHAAFSEPDVGGFAVVAVRAVAGDARDGGEVVECCHGSVKAEVDGGKLMLWRIKFEYWENRRDGNTHVSILFS
jgi:hypothetical protein